VPSGGCSRQVSTPEATDFSALSLSGKSFNFQNDYNLSTILIRIFFIVFSRNETFFLLNWKKVGHFICGAVGLLIYCIGCSLNFRLRLRSLSPLLNLRALIVQLVRVMYTHQLAAASFFLPFPSPFFKLNCGK